MSQCRGSQDLLPPPSPQEQSRCQQHAGSLAAGIPIEIDRERRDDDGSKVLEDLEKVQKDIISNGISLPSLHEGRMFRKVLKIHFSGQDGAPIPDPWLLAAKASVNLSSTRGQKLLPACKKGEEEDYELLQELHKYELRRRQFNLPAQVNFLGMGKIPGTPPEAKRKGVAVVTPPREGGDDWENLGDYREAPGTPP